jgi:hypothetical protein
MRALEFEMATNTLALLCAASLTLISHNTSASGQALTTCAADRSLPDAMETSPVRAPKLTTPSARELTDMSVGLGRGYSDSCQALHRPVTPLPGAFNTFQLSARACCPSREASLFANNETWGGGKPLAHCDPQGRTSDDVRGSRRLIDVWWDIAPKATLEF